MTAPKLTIYQNGVNQVSGDQLNTFEATCNQVSDLRGFIGTAGVQVYMRGYATADDGGQGPFYWNSSGTGPDDNGVTNIVPYGSVVGCWTRLFVPYQLNAAGSVLRTIQNKESDIVSALDFGAVGDDSTNNDTAAASAAAYANLKGLKIYWPSGKYRFNSTNGIPELNQTGAGFYGQPGATIFRHNAVSGNLITLDGANGAYGLTISGINFFPVLHKTSGAEILLKNGPNYPIIDKIFGQYVYQLINNTGSFYAIVETVGMLFSYAPSGAITMKGTSLSNANFINGSVLNNIWTGIGNETTGVPKGAWTIVTTYNLGDQVAANGSIWSCVQGGISLGSGLGPNTASLSFITSTSPWDGTVLFTDNTVKWVFFANLLSCSVLIDSYCFDVQLNSHNYNAGHYGLIVQDSVGLGPLLGSGGSAPNLVQSWNLFSNTNYQDCILLTGGTEVFFTDPQPSSALLGSGFNVTVSFSGDLSIKGGLSTNCGTSGITLNGGVNTIIDGHNASSNNRLLVSAANIAVGAVSNWKVLGCTLGTIAGGSARTSLGLSINPSATKFIVKDNDTSRNTGWVAGTPAISNSAGTSNIKIVSDNI